jgi:hypothetical protein
MTKEVKLKPTEAVEKKAVGNETKKGRNIKLGDGTPQKPEELKEVLSEEEINVKNSKQLRKTLKGINHNDLIGYIVLYNDHKVGRVGVMSSIDQAVSQFVALAHGGYIDKYDQIINQCITTRTIERMNPTPPKEISENAESIEDGKSEGESTE